ncbi:unnamed protein product [Rotaria sp. Silwood1]|nr:unnamed protein product [Rotaria sp. Silwood1]CAF3362692.1 unnamed protein product [Rotaria sp. Silwood1]CAF3366594.1 unnamed protein product [Rotaria sp. Silwood1]
MRICSDPLDTVRSTGSNQQWCIPLPAYYTTIIPYVPANTEYDGQRLSNITEFCSDISNYNRLNIIDSSLCAKSKLIQRIRHKIDLYQTPSSNDAYQILQHLTDIVKKHVPDFVFKETTDSKSKISQLESNNIVTNSNDQDNSTMNFPTPNVSTHHLSSDRITSAMDLRSSQYLSPSNQQQRTNKKSSEKQTLQTQSLTPNSLQRLPLINSQYNNQVQHTLIDKTEKRNNWINK